MHWRGNSNPRPCVFLWLRTSNGNIRDVLSIIQRSLLLIVCGVFLFFFKYSSFRFPRGLILMISTLLREFYFGEMSCMLDGLACNLVQIFRSPSGCFFIIFRCFNLHHHCFNNVSLMISSVCDQIFQHQSWLPRQLQSYSLFLLVRLNKQ